MVTNHWRNSGKKHGERYGESKSKNLAGKTMITSFPSTKKKGTEILCTLTSIPEGE